MLNLTEGELQQSILTLDELHRQNAFDSLPIDERSWMAGLGREEIHLLWCASHPEMSHEQVAHVMGWSKTTVQTRIRGLKKKLRVTRAGYQRFGRAVAHFSLEIARLRRESVVPVGPTPPKAA